MTIKREGGFSLIEIMVVIVIMGLLLSVVGPAVFQNISQAKTETAKAHMASMKTALQSYRLDNYTYPTTEQTLASVSVSIVEISTLTPYSFSKSEITSGLT